MADYLKEIHLPVHRIGSVLRSVPDWGIVLPHLFHAKTIDSPDDSVRIVIALFRHILPCIRRDRIRTEKGMRRSVRDRTLSSAHLAALKLNSLTA